MVNKLKKHSSQNVLFFFQTVPHTSNSEFFPKYDAICSHVFDLCVLVA